MHLTCLDELDPLLLPLCTDGGRGGAASSLLLLFVPWVILMRNFRSAFSFYPWPCWVGIYGWSLLSSLDFGRFSCCFYHLFGVLMGANRNHFANIFYFLIIGLIILCTTCWSTSYAPFNTTHCSPFAHAHHTSKSPPRIPRPFRCLEIGR